MFLISLIVTALVGIFPSIVGFRSRRPLGTSFFLIGVFIFNLLVFYLGLPALVGPFAGLTWILLINGALGALAAFALSDERDRWMKRLRMGSLLFPVFIAGLGIVFGIGSVMWFVDDEKIAMVGPVTMLDDWSDVHSESVSLDPENIRIRDRALASWKAQQAIADSDERGLGSRVSIGQGTIQMIEDGDDIQQLWAFPLEHAGFFKWVNHDTTPGYIVVSAENETPARLVTTLGDSPIEQRYMPSAYFGDNLRRYLYQNGYKSVRLEDFTYELNDDGRPFWVVTLTRPTARYAVREVTGVLVVDPQTGDIDEFAKKDFGTVPDWVDRIYSEEVFLERVKWYGALRDGWINSVFGQEGVVHPTPYGGAEVARFVIGDDGETYWITGVTSANTADTALDGFMLMNTRTGEMIEYRASGLNEAGALAAINDQVSNYANWSAAQPIVYNVYDRLAVIAPITADGQRLQSIAIVDLQSEQIAIGDNVNEALQEFARIIGVEPQLETAPATNAEVRSVESVITQIGFYDTEGDTFAVLQLSVLPGQLLRARVADHIELSLTQNDDTVTIEFLETDESVLPIHRFDNLEVPRELSDESGE